MHSLRYVSLLAQFFTTFMIFWRALATSLRRQHNDLRVFRCPSCTSLNISDLITLAEWWGAFLSGVSNPLETLLLFFQYSSLSLTPFACQATRPVHTASRLWVYFHYSARSVSRPIACLLQVWSQGLQLHSTLLHYVGHSMTWSYGLNPLEGIWTLNRL